MSGMGNILLGIGNTLRRDDGAGNYVASRFRLSGWESIDCGTAPENFSGIVRRERPILLVLVDAADMGLSPGEFAIIPEEKIRDVGLGTHQATLGFLIDLVREAAGSVVLIGIQPAVVEFGDGLSPAVRVGAQRLVGLLQRGGLERIPLLM